MYMTNIPLSLYPDEVLTERVVLQTAAVRQIETYFVFNNFFHKNRGFYEKMWKNISQPERPRMIISRMRIACWITHLRLCNNYCSSAAKWWHESAAVLLYTSIACRAAVCGADTFGGHNCASNGHLCGLSVRSAAIGHGLNCQGYVVWFQATVRDFSLFQSAHPAFCSEGDRGLSSQS